MTTNLKTFATLVGIALSVTSMSADTGSPANSPEPRVAVSQDTAVPSSHAPHLEKRGASTQLVVDGRPYLILGGEVFNSSASSLDYMKPLWSKLASQNINTVLLPVTWNSIEPDEGHFDFNLLDGLLEQARAEQERVVLLWFGSWKNGMSSYAPDWVKRDFRRFPREVANGKIVEVLTPLSISTQRADSLAFATLMKHLKEVDSKDHTVIMMQVEMRSAYLATHGIIRPKRSASLSPMFRES